MCEWEWDLQYNTLNACFDECSDETDKLFIKISAIFRVITFSA